MPSTDSQIEAAIAPASSSNTLMGFHMATAITQDTLNFQLKLLWEDKVIRNKLQVDAGAITLDADVGPPSVDLGDASLPGTVLFLLHLPKGSLGSWDFSVRPPQERKIDFENWTYAFRVNLNLVQIARDAALNGNAIPKVVKDKLQAFSDADFTIRQLFMDFQNANLASLDPARTIMKMPDGNDASLEVVDQFRKTLETYFKKLARDANPYILGYSVERKLEPSEPALFQPTGATFSTFQDSSDSRLNCLNFLLMTQNAELPKDRNAGRFKDNWVQSKTDDGRLVIEGAEFRRQYLDGKLLPALLGCLPLKRPASWQPNQTIRTQIEKSMGDSFILQNIDRSDQAKGVFELETSSITPVLSPAPLFNISNKLTRAIACTVRIPDNKEVRAQIDIAGESRVEVWNDTAPGSWANIREEWGSGTGTVRASYWISLKAGPDGRVIPEFIEKSFASNASGSTRGTANIASGIIDPLLKALGVKSFAETWQSLASQLSDELRKFTDTFKSRLPDVLGALENNIILPAGQVFFYKNIQFDKPRDVVLLDINYKTELNALQVPAVPVTFRRGGPLAVDSAGFAMLSSRHELMKHHLAARPIDKSHRIAVAQDVNGEPMVLSISEVDQHFLLLRRDKGRTGWQLVDLMPAVARDHVATVFEVSQRADGNLYFMLAVHPKNRHQESRIFVSPPVSNNHAVTDWNGLANRWVERPYGEKGEITQILLGTSDDGQGAPAAIVGLKLAGRATRVRINADASDNKWSSEPLELTENPDQLRDLALGTAKGRRGTFALYDLGQHQSLVFSSLPDGERSLHIPFKLPGKTHAIAVVTAPGQRTSDIYVAGEGVHVFRSGQAAVAVTAPSVLPNIRGLAVRSDDTSAVLWARTEEGRLMYIHGKEASWSPPVCLDKDVQQFVPLRNAVRRGNQLFTVSDRGRLHYRWQDPDSGAWSASDVPLPSTGTTTELDCYATHLVLRRDDKPLVNQSVQVSASGWTYAIINGESLILDATRPVEVQTDKLGSVTILQRITSLTAESLTITSAVLPEPVTIDPAAAIFAALKKYKTGESIAQASTRDGKPLFQSPPDPERCNKAAKAIQALAKAQEQLQNEQSGMLATDAQGAQDVVLWGISFAGHTISERPVINAIAAGVDDVMDSALRGLSDIQDFLVQVVNGAIEFVVTVGGQVLRLLIKVARDLYKAVHWLMQELLGIDLDDWIKWLGFVFAWDDILRTHQVMANVTRQTFAFAKTRVRELKPHVQSFFGKVRGMLDQFKELPEGTRDTRLMAQLTGQIGDGKEAQALDQPEVSWASYQFMHGGASAVQGNDGPAENPVTGLLTSLFEKVLIPIAESIGQTTVKVFRELVDAFTNGSLTISQVVLRLGQELLDGILDAGEKTAAGVLDLASEVLDAIWAVLDDNIELPVISGLYRDLTNGRPLTLLDGLLLLLSVPATALYKIATGEAPFTTGKSPLLATMRHEDLFSMFGSQTPAQAEVGDQALVGLADDALGGVNDPRTWAAELWTGALTILSIPAGFIVFLARGINAFVQPLTEGNAKATRLSLALGAVTWLCSFPLGLLSPALQSTSDWPSLGLWGLAFLGLVKDLFLCFVPTAAQKVADVIAGVLEIIACAVNLGLYIAVVVIDMVEGKDKWERDMAFWTFCENLAGTVGDFCVACTRFAKKPDDKAYLFTANAIAVVLSSSSCAVRAGVSAGRGEYWYRY